MGRCSLTRNAGCLELTNTARENIDRHLSSLRELHESNKGWEFLVAQWNFLCCIGLDEFYGCDINILPLIGQIPPHSEIIDIRTFLQHRLVEILLEKIESDESTILLDTKRMKNTPAEVLIPLIEELRRKEITNTSLRVEGREYLYYDVFMQEIDRKLIPNEGQRVDLEDLWLTAYGYQILTRSKIGLETDLVGLRKIERALNKRQIPLNLEGSQKDRVQNLTRISQTMKEFILSQAESVHSLEDNQ